MFPKIFGRFRPNGCRLRWPNAGRDLCRRRTESPGRRAQAQARACQRRRERIRRPTHPGYRTYRVAVCRSSGWASSPPAPAGLGDRCVGLILASEFGWSTVCCGSPVLRAPLDGSPGPSGCWVRVSRAGDRTVLGIAALDLERRRRHLVPGLVGIAAQSRCSADFGRTSHDRVMLAPRHRWWLDRPSAGDWLSGRAPRSHRGGHWFEPSIAHQQRSGTRPFSRTPRRPCRT